MKKDRFCVRVYGGFCSIWNPRRPKKDQLRMHILTRASERRIRQWRAAQLDIEQRDYFDTMRDLSTWARGG